MPHLETLCRCPISGAADLEPLPGFERHHLVRSRTSGLVFCNVVPSQTELLTAYSAYQRSTPPPPLSRLRFYELLRTLEAHRLGGEIIDIGCGSGHFLEAAAELGWKVSGTEFSTEAVAECKRKGIEVFPGSASAEVIGHGRYDVVTCMEVIEHLQDPLREVRKAFDLLRPGGIFYFTTPNFDCLERFILGDRYDIICFPEHLCYFTPKTVDFMLTKAGFSAVSLYTQGFSLSRIASSIRNPGGAPNSPPPKADEAERRATHRERSIDEGIRRAIANSRILECGKGAVNSFLDAFGIGSSLRGVYLKPKS